MNTRDAGIEAGGAPKARGQTRRFSGTRRLSFVRSSVVRSPRFFRRRDNFFDDAKIFEKKVWVDAIDFVQKSSKSELSSVFLSRSKLKKFTCHFLANLADRPGIYVETLYESNFPQDVC